MSVELINRDRSIPKSMEIYSFTLQLAYAKFAKTIFISKRYSIFSIVLFLLFNLFKRKKSRKGVVRHVTEQNLCFFYDKTAFKNFITVHDLHALIERRRSGKGNFSIIFWKYFFIKFDCIFVPSITTFDAVVNLIERSDKVKILPNVIQFNIPFSEDKQKIFDVLLVGSSWYKNHLFHFSALSKLSREREIKIAWLDPGDDLQIIQMYANDLNIRFFKNLSKDEVLDIYSQSRILCFCSIIEGFGYPILEAIFSKVHIITSVSVAKNYPWINQFNSVKILAADAAVEDLVENIKIFLESKVDPFYELSDEINQLYSINNFSHILFNEYH